MFLLASGRHVGASQMDTYISPNISKMKNCTDLNLGDSPCIFNSSYFPNSRLILMACQLKLAVDKKDEYKVINWQLEHH